MKKFITAFLLASIIIVSALAGYAGFSQQEEGSVKQKLPPVAGDAIIASDYSMDENWLHIADTNFEADVFYLYPTSWTRNRDEPYDCQIDNTSMRQGAQFHYTAKATAFETSANVYAPFYRQIDARWLLDDISFEEGEKYFDGVPYTDALAAFEYYLEHYNNGKPFILAGHSQGAAVIKTLLKDYMAEHPDVYERMVAAYIIGYSVTEQELHQFPHLKFAERADDTGVIVSWNTEAPGTKDNPLLFDGAIAINPISWTRAEEPASQEQNLGSLISNRSAGTLKELEHLADAAVDHERGSVICSSVDIDTYASGKGMYPRGVYHVHDWGFYYHNIRENAKTRIDAYLKNESLSKNEK